LERFGLDLKICISETRCLLLSLLLNTDPEVYYYTSGTLNGLHGTNGTVNGTLNGLHGTTGTENGLKALASISFGNSRYLLFSSLPFVYLFTNIKIFFFG
jgi:hypothetical protein